MRSGPSVSKLVCASGLTKTAHDEQPHARGCRKALPAYMWPAGLAASGPGGPGERETAPGERTPLAGDMRREVATLFSRLRAWLVAALSILDSMPQRRSSRAWFSFSACFTATSLACTTCAAALSFCSVRSWLRRSSAADDFCLYFSSISTRDCCFFCAISFALVTSAPALLLASSSCFRRNCSAAESLPCLLSAASSYCAFCEESCSSRFRCTSPTRTFMAFVFSRLSAACAARFSSAALILFCTSSLYLLVSSLRASCVLTPASFTLVLYAMVFSARAESSALRLTSAFSS
mmetsp:Transcript_63461/g.151344  ORF Transcript_63461/g.151344 Transcript_63461/m.151344 type:complete len:293 (-) Transcript_63461:1588-2466(-)